MFSLVLIKMFDIEEFHFSLPVGMHRKSCCATLGFGIGCGGGGIGGGGGCSVSKMLKLYIKVFYVMGKVLLGKLSCTWTGLIA